MNQKIIRIVVVAVLVGLGLYMFLGNKKAKNTADSSMTGSQEVAEGPFSGTLKAAVALGVPMKCTYTVEGAEFGGIIKGKQYRGTISTPDGKQGNILMKENCLYSWEKDQAQGIKMCYDITEKDIWEEEDSSSMVEAYNCVPTAVSDSEFEAPSDVEFLDTASFMQGVPTQYQAE